MPDSNRELVSFLSVASLAAIVACSSEAPQMLPTSTAGASGAPTAGSNSTTPAAGSTAGTASATPPPAPGSSGSPAALPSAGAAAGAAGAPQPSAAGASGSPPPSTAGTGAAAPAAGAPAAGAGSPSQPANGGNLPPITDPGAKGTFEIEVKEMLDGLTTHVLIAPKELGRDGIKHPVLVWVNGAGANSSSYRAMLDNVAAHGFVVVDDKQSSFESMPEVVAQRAAIDWVIDQANKQGGPYQGKLDAERIAIGGHSMGSVSSFGNVKDPRIKTSIHMAGGLTGNPEGVDESWLKDLHAPAAFLCGSADNGLTRARNDFAGVDPKVPVFFGILAGVGHTDEFSATNGGRWGRIVIAWLRWQLAGDDSFARSFTGADCEFCKGDWSAMKHAID